MEEDFQPVRHRKQQNQAQICPDLPLGTLRRLGCLHCHPELQRYEGLVVRQYPHINGLRLQVRRQLSTLNPHKGV